MQKKLPYQFIDKLILGTENKLKIVREYRGLSIEQLARMATLDKECVSFIETHKIELLTPDLSKLAEVLQIDEDLLLDNSILISPQEERLLRLIFCNIKSPEEKKKLQQQILNWLAFILNDRYQKWHENRKNSVEMLYSADKKAEAYRRGKSRDKKYAPFREYFRNLQKKRFIEFHNRGKIMSANSFVIWFLEHQPRDIEIPYRKSNLKNKLIQLAQINNREFKKAFECKS